ncbi:hypothetical protein VFPPC_16989 [Pochonia chlamydosporia 170]|uniref:Uncharacterized protein n=1 Tax=Pochonia chlamydosporia 170 TaxID=1380566 RepID=A0A179EYV6_METCM|nr:hypothetical protein VFPPC_16989 [Pochonia chlamydosporia 170]OAQ58387.1 hypothetical protein VFPPC_16989 [Pochonia chlamydosporia 170]
MNSKLRNEPTPAIQYASGTPSGCKLLTSFDDTGMELDALLCGSIFRKGGNLRICVQVVYQSLRQWPGKASQADPCLA